jgi:hypothetical protein
MKIREHFNDLSLSGNEWDIVKSVFIIFHYKITMNLRTSFLKSSQKFTKN